MVDPGIWGYSALAIGSFEAARVGFMRWLRAREQRAFDAGRLALPAPAATSPLNTLGKAVAQVQESDGTVTVIVRPDGLGRARLLGDGK